MDSPPTKPNLEDSGCALLDGNLEGENTMLDHLEMSGMDESKSSLKDESPVQEKRGFHAFIARWEESPERNKFYEIWEKHSLSIILVCVTVALLVYSIAAIAHSGFDKAKPLFGLTMFLWFCMTYMVISNHCGAEIYQVVLKPIAEAFSSRWRYLKWILLVVVVVLLGVFFGLDTAKKPERFISLAGLALNILFCWIFSKHPRKVKWRPVIWGLALQFVFGLLILRTKFGFEAFKGVGNQVTAFLDYTSVGAAFVFGTGYREHFFAFQVLPIIIFFSSVISLCYYIGIMQVVIKKIAWLMQITMKTSGVESLNAAGNIFIGQTEAPLMIRPFLEHVTMSELHAIMTGGFATIAGSVLAAYIEYGVSASHLLSASVMSAPAALAISKLMYPETEIPETLNEENIELPKGNERNVIEAAAKGASTAIALVANIAANLIAFLAFLAFFNGVLSWLGSMVGKPELSFEYICSYVLRPVAFIMGVPWEDSDVVAELLGIKTFLNEFVAYTRLATIIENRTKMTGLRTISIRAEIITTYALCGFANMSSVGVVLGGLGPMAPSRVPDMSKIAVRALVAGTVACFMTACVAGVLYDESLYEGVVQIATTVAANTTTAPP
ncbi:solute carrier family 28 member 3-like isoform X2 [Stylophora pistillata]|uniref:solute carrier family 28 member 3-like isoform X2 n=1 Tax=Stylophora pistillata TaxID=50429 RepID=UPI000C039286|nr:solute carrier family 28 member 3-like isoform X2 [Stylophora pistillata]